MTLPAEICCINVLDKFQFTDSTESGPFSKLGHVPYMLGLKMKSRKISSY